MSSIKLVLDIGLEFIPGAGKVLSAGLGKQHFRRVMNISYFGYKILGHLHKKQIWLQLLRRWLHTSILKKKTQKGRFLGG